MATYDLATLDEVKEFMNMTGSNSTVDTLLEDLITRWSDIFAKMCGVDQFKAKEYTEYYDGNGVFDLHPDHKPVNSVSLLASDYDWVFGSDTTYGSDEYAILDDNVVLKDEVFPEGRRNIKITYNAGYSTIPTDLKLACVMEVARIYNRRESIDVSAKTYDAGGSITKYIEGMLPETKMILKRYQGTGVY